MGGRLADAGMAILRFKTGTYIAAEVHHTLLERRETLHFKLWNRENLARRESAQPNARTKT